MFSRTASSYGLVVLTLIVSLATGCAPAPVAAPTAAPSKPAPAAAPPASAKDKAPAAAAEGKPAAKQPSTPAEIFAYSGPDRQQILEEGARKEGKVLLYTVMTLDVRARPLANAFQEKYPFITVDIARLGTTEISKRAYEEYQANKYVLDVVESAIDTFVSLKSAGILAKFSSPELSEYTNDFKDPEGYFVADREAPLMFSYNTNLVPEADAPKTYDDLLNPKLKGKLSTNDGNQGLYMLGGMLQMKGEEFVRNLARQEVAVHSLSSDALLALNTTGEVAISFPNSIGNILAAKDKGAPMGLSALDKPAVNQLGYVGVAARAEHPHAAALFADFLLSEAGQKVMVSTGTGGTRKGIQNDYGDYVKEKLNLELMIPQNQYASEQEKWRTLQKTLFTKRSGA
jgi:iron(III) transport system substrate-binding protein